MTAGPMLSLTAGSFGERVRQSFGRRAAHYDRHARLQQATAWRLGRWCRRLSLPPGPSADLGAGSGLLSRALLLHPQLRDQPPLQLDQCAALLARNPLIQPAEPGGAAASSLIWDLNGGLPGELQGAALLASSFALQWLDHPARQLRCWCSSLAPGGWLLLAVPTAGSFPQWHQAAARAGVPCTALCLPRAEPLCQAVREAGLRLHRTQRLRFSRPHQGGLETLRHLRQLGASASRQAPLTAGQLRRLLGHWPQDSPLTWEVLLLLARREEH